MTQPKRCELDWCTAPHDDDDHSLHHHNHLGEYRTDTATVDVVARWAERLDGRRGVDPHVSIFTTTAGEEHTIDLTPHEARIWAGQLEAFDAAPWLAERLTAGADMLREWEVNEYAGVPHRVADRPTHPPESYVFALRAAVGLSRATLASFEELPTTTMAALDLSRWIGEFRTCVRSLVQTVEALDTAGGLA